MKDALCLNHPVSVDHKVWVTGLTEKALQMIHHVAPHWKHFFTQNSFATCVPLLFAYVESTIPLYLWDWMGQLRDRFSFFESCLVVDSCWWSIYENRAGLAERGLLSSKRPGSQINVTISEALRRWWDLKEVTILSVAPVLWIPEFNAVRLASTLEAYGVVVMQKNPSSQTHDDHCKYLMGGGWSPHVAQADVMWEFNVISLADQYAKMSGNSIFLIRHETGTGGSSWAGLLAWYLLSNTRYGVEAFYYMDGRSIRPQDMREILRELKSHPLAGSALFLDNATDPLLREWFVSDVPKRKHPLLAVVRSDDISDPDNYDIHEIHDVPIPRKEPFQRIAQHYRTQMRRVRSNWQELDTDWQDTHALS